jgi:hypothetical protein
MTKNSHHQFYLKDDLELVDTTGQILRENKKGKIPDSLPPLLARLNLNSKLGLTWSNIWKVSSFNLNRK